MLADFGEYSCLLKTQERASMELVALLTTKSDTAWATPDVRYIGTELVNIATTKLMNRVLVSFCTRYPPG